MGTARAFDGGLIHEHHVLPAHTISDQRGLPRSGHPGHRRQHPQRQVHIHRLEVVLLCATDGQDSRRRPGLLPQPGALIEGASGGVSAACSPARSLW